MKFKDYIESIEQFFRDNGIKIDPLPTISFFDDAVDFNDPFIKTGSYFPDDRKIVLQKNGRQCKDILRSFAHELWHHSQFLRDPESFNSVKKGYKLEDSPELEALEGDTYLNGNVLFRKWTEQFK